MIKSTRMLLIGAAALVTGAAGYLLVSNERPWSAMQASPGHVFVEQTTLESKLILAVDHADQAAQDRLRSELEAWKDGMMMRVDPAFLDWYFAYFRTRWADLKWLARWLWGLGDATDADKRHFAEIVSAFAEQVVSPQKAQEDIDRIIRSAAQDFMESLSAAITTYRMAAGAGLPALDARLEAIVFRDDRGRAQFSLKDIALQPRTAGLSSEWIEQWLKRYFSPPAPQPGELADGQRVAQMILSTVNAGINAGNFATATATALGAEQATAAAIGTTACAVVVIAVIGVQDYWAHERFVEANRDKLRGGIEASLKEFTTAAMHKDGVLGRGLHALKSHVISTIQGRTLGVRA